MSADGADGSRPDPAAILDDVVSLIGTDVARMRALVETTERVLTAEEARILAGYAQALGNVARARKVAEDEPLTPEEEAAVAEFAGKWAKRDKP